MKQKTLQCQNLEISRNVLQDKLEKAADDKNNLRVELEDKNLESHELKVTSNLLEEKLKKAKAKFLDFCKSAKEEKEKLTEKVDFLDHTG